MYRGLGILYCYSSTHCLGQHMVVTEQNDEEAYWPHWQASDTNSQLPEDKALTTALRFGTVFDHRMCLTCVVFL